MNNYEYPIHSYENPHMLHTVYNIKSSEFPGVQAQVSQKQAIQQGWERDLEVPWEKDWFYCKTSAFENRFLQDLIGLVGCTSDLCVYMYMYIYIYV